MSLELNGIITIDKLARYNQKIATTYASASDLEQTLQRVDALENNTPDVYQLTSDNTNIDEIVEGITPRAGDMLVITTSMGIKSAYQYDVEDGWVACDGNVDASKVIMPFDITLAGSYTQVGNLSKSSTGTATFSTKGKSVAAALQEMLSKREQPKIKTNPSVSLTATNGAYEVGTKITPTWSASLGAGSYTYGPATGITAKTWAISDTAGHTASTASGSFAQFVVDDDTEYSITAKATYDAGAIAVDNLGDPSNPTIQIAAGSKSATGSKVTGYRSWFMYIGNSMDKIDSAFIRKATNKGNGKNATTQTEVTIPDGTNRILIAIPQDYDSELTIVTDVDGMGLDMFGNFTLSEVEVEGVDGHKAVKYNVWSTDNEKGYAATRYTFVIE